MPNAAVGLPGRGRVLHTAVPDVDDGVDGGHRDRVTRGCGARDIVRSISKHAPSY